MSGHSAVGSSSLYCPEDAEDAVQSRPDTWISSANVSSFPHSPPYDDDCVVDRLFESELHQYLHSDYLRLCLHPTSRQDSINWILKVHAHYHFKPVTALLSVNYFDRFLSSQSLPGSGWPYQLLAVACLSLAAKMEEPYVPLLIDLQILEPRYVFEPQTIQRMELWVMAYLKWRLRLVTPYDFLDYFISKLPSRGPISDPFLLNRIITSSSDLVLSTIRVTDFLGYSPSIIAAAAVMLAGGSEQLPDAFYERVNKETLRSCHQLMQEYLVDSCPSTDPKVRSRLEAPASPPSPIGVLDAAAACASCDTRSENPGSSMCGTDAGEAEPEPKRLRSSVAGVQE